LLVDLVVNPLVDPLVDCKAPRRCKLYISTLPADFLLVDPLVDPLVDLVVKLLVDFRDSFLLLLINGGSRCYVRIPAD
jgi:hypothetical protein